MLFSNDSVANFINENFEPVWVSVRPVPIVTLEMAVGSVRRDRDATGAPDPFTLYRALRLAVGTSDGEA